MSGDEGILEARERNMLCSGCLGDRNAHWDSSCWILRCCVDGKGHSNCSECGCFPCAELAGWSLQNAGYTKAFERLTQLHKGK